LDNKSITILRRIDELEHDVVTASIVQAESEVHRVFGLDKEDMLYEIAVRIESAERFEAFKSSTKPVDAQLRIWLDHLLQLQEIEQRLTQGYDNVK